MWTDLEWTSKHEDGHRVAAFGEPGQPVQWWAYHKDHRRARLRTFGPEPMGPFLARETAKDAVLTAYVEKSA